MSPIEPVQVPGLEFHSFLPIDKIGQRVQLGALLGFGIARVPGTAIQKRIDGPPFVASPTSFEGLATVPAGGGFVLDETNQAIPVAPGQTGTTLTTSAIEVSPLDKFLFLLRTQIAADVLLAAPVQAAILSRVQPSELAVVRSRNGVSVRYWPLTRGPVSALFIALVLSLGRHGSHRSTVALERTRALVRPGDLAVHAALELVVRCGRAA